ncbi:oligosaccharide flippase family protein [Haloferax denitrificans]|uniref:oligosaccharide flippase family protein n=1 Tax=Haloferax denitrificans TaxID=35745 RepID=UPI003C6EA6EF
MNQAKNINIRRQATISFAGNLADTGISFVGLVTMAYVLGAGDLGRYYFILAVIEVALFPATGLSQAVLKRGSEESQNPAEIFGTGLALGLGYVAVVSVLFAAAVLSDFVALRYSPDVVFTAIAVFVSQAVLLIQIDAYRSYGHTGYATLVDNVCGILQTFLQLFVLWMGFRIFGLLAVTVIAILVTVAGHYFVSVITISRPRMSAARSLIEYGRWSMVTAGVSKLYKRLPELVLGYFGMNAAIGYYTSADRLLMLGSYVSGSLGPALMAKTSSQGSGDTPAEMLGEFEQIHHHVTILAVAFAFGSFALAKPLMQTFFDMSDPMAITGLIGLSFYHIIQALSGVEYSFFDGMDMPELGTKSITLGLFVQIALISVLFSQFDFIGVISAIVLANFAMLLYAQTIFWEEFGIIPLPSGLITQMISGVIMYVAVDLVADVTGISTVFHLLAVVAFGAIIYITMLVLVDTAFRELVRVSVRDMAAILRGQSGS